MSRANQDSTADGDASSPIAPQLKHEEQSGLPSVLENETQSTTNRPWNQQGRAIKRLVTLFDTAQDLVDAAARQQPSGSTGNMDLQCISREKWLLRAYGHLIARLPHFGQWVTNPASIGTVDIVAKQLSEGADSARGSDAALLKTRVVSWLSERNPPEPHLSPSDKAGCGFHNDSMARLICPVDYDWDKSGYRDKIRGWDPEYLVMADMWPRFLYEEHTYNPDEPTKGLFKGPMLVRVFKAIFTYPSSADEEDGPVSRLVPRKRRRGERRTRRNVAGLVAVRSVEPRAIAYVVVQLQFALSSRGTWGVVDGLFDHNTFYQNIVRWFEETEDTADKVFVDDLLLWWNRYGNRSRCDIPAVWFLDVRLSWTMPPRDPGELRWQPLLRGVVRMSWGA